MKKLCLLLLQILFIVICSCSNESSTEIVSSTNMKLNGFTQKGPFVSGSAITIQELDDSFNPNGKSFQTTTNDDFGSFSLSSEISTKYVELIARGYYFNETNGCLSESELTLRAVVDVAENKAANINILTTLTKDRLIYLARNNKLSFADAKKQAEKEILAAFNIPNDSINNFETMDITKPGTNNAVLLAISATLQCGNNVAQLSELLSKINLDLKTDGALSDNLIQQYRSNSKIVDYIWVRKSLRNRYEQLGQSVAIPKFEDYLDSDGDGIINKNDDETWVWEHTNMPFSFYEYFGCQVIEFNSKIYLFLYSDGIWTVDDSLKWTKISNFSSYFCNSFVHDNKIWTVYRADNNPNSPKKLSYSDDGITWTNASPSIILDANIERIVTFKNKIYAYNSQSNVVYNSENGIDWTPATSNISGNCDKKVSFKNRLWTCYNNKLLSSADGIFWDESGTAPTLVTNVSYSLTVLNSKLLLMPSEYVDGTSWYNFYLYATEDGTTWNILPTMDIYSISTYFSCTAFNKLWIFHPWMSDSIYIFTNYKKS